MNIFCFVLFFNLSYWNTRYMMFGMVGIFIMAYVTYVAYAVVLGLA